jgi:hypothetical protein
MHAFGLLGHNKGKTLCAFHSHAHFCSVHLFIRRRALSGLCPCALSAHLRHSGHKLSEVKEESESRGLESDSARCSLSPHPTSQVFSQALSLPPSPSLCRISLHPAAARQKIVGIFRSNSNQKGRSGYMHICRFQRVQDLLVTGRGQALATSSTPKVPWILT